MNTDTWLDVANEMQTELWNTRTERDRWRIKAETLFGLIKDHEQHDARLWPEAMRVMNGADRG